MGEGGRDSVAVAVIIIGSKGSLSAAVTPVKAPFMMDLQRSRITFVPCLRCLRAGARSAVEQPGNRGIAAAETSCQARE